MPRRYEQYKREEYTSVYSVQHTERSPRRPGNAEQPGLRKLLWDHRFSFGGHLTVLPSSCTLPLGLLVSACLWKTAPSLALLVLLIYRSTFYWQGLLYMSLSSDSQAWKPNWSSPSFPRKDTNCKCLALRHMLSSTPPCLLTIQSAKVRGHLVDGMKRRMEDPWHTFIPGQDCVDKWKSCHEESHGIFMTMQVK